MSVPIISVIMPTFIYGYRYFVFFSLFLLTEYYFFKHIRVRMEIIARNLWMLALLLMLTSTTSWAKIAINKLTLVIFIWIDFLAFTVPAQKRKSIS
jgi:hypothetical protein